MPAVSGSSNSPELVADTPVTTCRNKGRKTTPPKSAHPMMRLSTELADTSGSRNRRNGRIGSVVCASHVTNAAVNSAPSRMSVTMIGELQGYSVSPQTSANSRQLTPATSNSAPSMSIRCGRCTTGRRNTLDVTTSDIAPTGRLIRKTQRHDVWSTMKPPIQRADDTRKCPDAGK